MGESKQEIFWLDFLREFGSHTPNFSSKLLVQPNLHFFKSFRKPKIYLYWWNKQNISGDWVFDND